MVGEIPLPYVLEKQKYNLTDEILRRLKIHKDFNELYDEIQKQIQTIKSS